MKLLGEELLVDNGLTVWGNVYHVKLNQEKEGLVANQGEFDGVEYFTREQIADHIMKSS